MTHTENVSRSDQCKATVAHQELSPNSFTLLEILFAWKTHIYHTGSSNNYRSIVGGLIAGGTSDRSGRQACFFSEERTGPWIDIFPNGQLSDNSVNLHAIRSIGKGCETPQKEYGDRSSARYETNARHRSCMHEKTDATTHGNSIGRTRCVVTAQSSRIGLRTRGEPEQSPVNED